MWAPSQGFLLPKVNKSTFIKDQAKQKKALNLAEDSPVYWLPFSLKLSLACDTLQIAQNHKIQGGKK